MRGALLLFIAAAAQAQPIIGPEVVWRTTSAEATYRPARQAAPLAADVDGFVVAWSEVIDSASRAYAGRLDAAGRLQTIGVRTFGTADAAVIAPFAGRYLAAWLEPEASDGRPLLVTGALDRSFRLLSTKTSDFIAADAPILRAGGTHAFVADGTAFSELNSDGLPMSSSGATYPIDDLAIVEQSGLPSQVAYVSRYFHQEPNFCFFGCGSTTHLVSTLNFNWYFGAAKSLDGANVKSPLGIGSNGREFLVVWFDDVQRAVMGSVLSPSARLFGPFVFGGAHAPASLDPVFQPEVASDGSRWMVVWARENGIEAATVAPGGARSAFTISAHGLRPAIATIAPGRFVITYEVVGFDQRQLVSRVIDFNAPTPRIRPAR